MYVRTVAQHRPMRPLCVAVPHMCTARVVMSVGDRDGEEEEYLQGGKIAYLNGEKQYTSL